MQKTTVLSLVVAVAATLTAVESRVEWPVFFEHLGFVHSIHNKWDLTINIHFYLPSLDARLSKTLHRLRLLRGQEDEGHHHDGEGRDARNGRPSKLQQLQESWQTLNRHLTKRSMTLKRRSQNMRGLSNARPKRKRREASPLKTKETKFHKRIKRQDGGLFPLYSGGGSTGGLFKVKPCFVSQIISSTIYIKL